MTILRLAHLDAEGLVMDGKVRALRDQFVTHTWSQVRFIRNPLPATLLVQAGFYLLSAR